MNKHAPGEPALPQPQLFTLNAAAEFLAISPRKLWAEAEAGRIPRVRIGRAIRFDRDDLLSYVLRQKQQGAQS